MVKDIQNRIVFVSEKHHNIFKYNMYDITYRLRLLFVLCKCLWSKKHYELFVFIFFIGKYIYVECAMPVGGDNFNKTYDYNHHNQ
jgi:hypothetical protein